MGERHSYLANLYAHLLFYCPDNEGIIVARVLHHARDIQSIEWWPRH